MVQARVVLGAIAMFCLATTARADVIVAFVPEAGGPPSPWADATGTPPPTTVHANVTASFLDRVGAAEQGSDTTAVYPGWAASTVTNGDYTSFTVTPNAGFAITFDSLSYALESYGAMNDAEGYTMNVRTSLNNFTTNVASQTIRNSSAGVFNLNLAPLADQLTTPVEFRIFIRNNFLASGRADVTALNGGLVLNGSLEAVPEPASGLLLGAGLMGVWALKRRRT